MFSKLPIPQRIQVGLILGIAFLLVFGSNRLDKRHFNTVQNTVNSVYKDRVVVQDFIYRLNNIVHKKQMLLKEEQSLKVNESQNEQVVTILDDFSATKLTSKESALLQQLKVTFTALMDVEKSGYKAPDDKKNSLAIKKLDQIQTNLNGLAEVQLNESGQLTQLSNKSLNMNILMSKLEIGFLILIGIIMLVLVFGPRKDVASSPTP